MSFRIIHATGQMCNQFWILSSFIANCIERNEKISIWLVDFDLTHFDKLYNNKYISYPLYPKILVNFWGFKKYSKFINSIFNNKFSIRLAHLLFNLIPGIRFEIADVTNKKSEFRRKHFQQMMSIFQSNSIIYDDVVNSINNYRSKNKLVIGIHIRYGDYKIHNGGKYFYSLDSYLGIMKNLKSLFTDSDVCFLICSNESIDVKNFKSIDCFQIPNANSTKDLIGLSMCDYICGPPSTFSAWASLYNCVPLYFAEKSDKYIFNEDFIDIRTIWF